MFRKPQSAEEKRYEQFVDSLHEAIGECLQKGTAAKLQIQNMSGRTVTIEIYQNAGDMAALGRMVSDAVERGKVSMK